MNPSSGNLHPTEAYVVRDGCVWHYAPEVHALEQRCAFEPSAWDRLGIEPARAFLVGLTSIHWREAWKYGERAFRYCQLDVGHAVACVAYAAALLGWRVETVPGLSSTALALLLGLDRRGDFTAGRRDDVECETPELLLALHTDPAASGETGAALPARAEGAQWHGRASAMRSYWPWN